MTKQEEIEKGIKEWVLEIRQYLCNTEFAPEPFKMPVDADVLTVTFPQKLLNYLHSKGLVIKIERELPINPWHNPPTYWESEFTRDKLALTWSSCQQDMLKARYVAVEPLIGEK